MNICVRVRLRLRVVFVHVPIMVFQQSFAVRVRYYLCLLVFLVSLCPFLKASMCLGILESLCIKNETASLDCTFCAE